MDRVTEILDRQKEDGLIDWFIKNGKKECRRVSTIATKIGSRVHKLIEKDLRGEPLGKINPSEFEVTNCMEAWKKFRERHQVVPDKLEEELKSEEHQIIGHRDFKGWVDEKYLTLDYKTSSMLNLKNWIQVNTYDWLAKWDTPFVGLVRLDKNLGIFDYQVYKRDEKLVNLFLNMVSVKRGFYDANGVYKGESTNGTRKESSCPTESTIGS